jgi:hypothetical protein
MLDPSKRRQRVHIEKALEGFTCAHGVPVVLHWHPRRSDGWFDVGAHCEQGRADATELADDAFAQVRPPGA